MESIPITVFTGFLGSGKTTLILEIIKKLPVGYNTVLLKNEFGEAETDSALARETNLQVTEMTNGCLCCVLVGQLKNALEEIRDKYRPDRIIVETSGSAFPAPIAWQIRKMDGFVLDSIMTVVDCKNFVGYEDTSYTARLQAKYTDLILLNKVELVTERGLDLVIDKVCELNADTARTIVRKGSAPPLDLVFGVDTRLFPLSSPDQSSPSSDHQHQHQHDDHCPDQVDTSHSDNEVTEMTNGCLCCVLVGQLKNALEEIRDKYRPDRIIVETSGSAFPAPIAWQIRKMDGFVLDSIMTVVDCKNFVGYEDTSYTARLQAKYTDLILLNKVELVTERGLDLVIDKVCELNADTARTIVRKGSAPPLDLVFGVDTRLFPLSSPDQSSPSSDHQHQHQHDDHCPDQVDTSHSDNEVDLIQVLAPLDGCAGYDFKKLNGFLGTLPPEDVYRVKGIVLLSVIPDDILKFPDIFPSGIPTTHTPQTASMLYILNFAFGRFTLTPITSTLTLHELKDTSLKLTFMGSHLYLYQSQISDFFNLLPLQISVHFRK
ncbi:COBW domain-containing protein [Smittium mucronatum]|uniref:COBW domain-containing protein n=1 Tax=Smittium mucronatum TaxID=133383 RepID=A0A1R0H184_9FUNG|nr:COBW domain-containing protein [Smittium mucronatum]